MNAADRQQAGTNAGRDYLQLCLQATGRRRGRCRNVIWIAIAVGLLAWVMLTGIGILLR